MTHELTIRFGDIFDAGVGAGANWSIYVESELARLPVDADDRIIAIAAHSGTLDDSGTDVIGVAPSPPGSHLILIIDGQTAGPFRMPAEDASAGELLREYVPGAAPLPREGPPGPYYVWLYRSTTSTAAPPAPTGATVVPRTGVITPPSGWAIVPPSPPSDGELWASQARITDTEPTTPVEPPFSAPYPIGAAPTAHPQPGTRVYVQAAAPAGAATGSIWIPTGQSGDDGIVIRELTSITPDVWTDRGRGTWVVADPDGEPDGGDMTTVQIGSKIYRLAGGGGGGALVHDDTLDGDGTVDAPLHVDNPFTSADEAKLDGIEAGAEVNVKSDWDSTSGDSEILNKPSIPDAFSGVTTESTLIGDGTAGDPLGLTNPFTSADGAKLDGIQAGAQVNPDAQTIIEQIDGDSGGDIDFSRVGDDTAASLRGEIRNMAVDDAALADGVKDLLLPEFPPAGERDTKVAKFAGDTLDWAADDTGIELSDTVPQPPQSPPVPGSGSKASRDDHVHRPPTWTETTGKPEQVTAIPPLPAAGSRDKLVLGFDGDAEAWIEADTDELHTAQVQPSTSATQYLDFPIDALADIFTVRFGNAAKGANDREDTWLLDKRWLPALNENLRWAPSGVANNFVQILRTSATHIRLGWLVNSTTSNLPAVLEIWNLEGSAPAAGGSEGPGIRERVVSLDLPGLTAAGFFSGAPVSLATFPLTLAAHEVAEIALGFELQVQAGRRSVSGQVALRLPDADTFAFDNGGDAPLDFSLRNAPPLEWRVSRAAQTVRAAGVQRVLNLTAQQATVTVTLRGDQSAFASDERARSAALAAYVTRSGTGSGGAPTLAGIVSALGLAPVDEANRSMIAARRTGDEGGLVWTPPDAVGWIDSKTAAAAKIRAVGAGYGFAANAGRDTLDFTAPDTTDPWPTPTKFDGFTEASYPAADTDLMAMEGADGLVKIGVSDLRAFMREGTIDHVRVVQHGARTDFAAPPSGWTWDIENHLTGNDQRDPRHISLAATGGATPDSAQAWWQQVFQGGTARIRLKSDSSGAGVEVTCDAPARGIKQGQPFYLFDLILSDDLSVTAATGQTTAQLPVEFSFLRADVAVIADTFDIEGATITSPQPNVAKIVLPAPEPLHAGDGIQISNDIVSIKPPPYIGGFWGNAQEGSPDVEVMRLTDLVVEDNRDSQGTDITLSKGLTIRGLAVPAAGIGMLDGQKTKLTPAPGSTPSGQAPAGVGKFTPNSDGDFVWAGNWPSAGLDIVVEIDMSDFQTGDYIHLTATCSNDSLWGSARTPDRGTDFHGGGDRLRHDHTQIYELRPTGSVPNGTKISLFAEAIRPPDRDTNASIGLYRGGQFTQRYQPSDPTVAHQVFTLGNPVRNTSIDAIGADAWLLPVTYSNAADNTSNNHLDVDSGDSVFEFTRDLRNCLMELLSHSNTVGGGWTFEMWTYAPGEIDWHRVRSYDVPSPATNTQSNPVVHRYFDTSGIDGGQQFVYVARGDLGNGRSAANMGGLTVALDTNPDPRFPARQEKAKGLITTEVLAPVESQRASGQRTWAKPATGLGRWQTIIVSVEDGNGAQHTASFDVRSWRVLDESKQMNANVYSEPALGANQELSRGSDGRLTYDSGSASVMVVDATLHLER